MSGVCIFISMLQRDTDGGGVVVYFYKHAKDGYR